MGLGRARRQRAAKKATEFGRRVLPLNLPLREESYGFLDMPGLDVFGLETLAEHQQRERNCQGPFALDEVIRELREARSDIVQAGFAEHLLDCRSHQNVRCPTTLLTVESVVIAPKWVIVPRLEGPFIKELAAQGTGYRVMPLDPIRPLGSLSFEQETIEERDRHRPPSVRALDEEAIEPKDVGERRLGDDGSAPNPARIPDAWIVIPGKFLIYLSGLI